MAEQTVERRLAAVLAADVVGYMRVGCRDIPTKRLPPSRPTTPGNPGFGLADLVIAYREQGQADKAEHAARRLMSARRDFTIAAWLKTQFRRDTVRLEADAAALRIAGLPGA